MSIKWLASGLLVTALCLLTSCASNPEQPYWEDPSWVKQLVGAFHFYYPGAAVDENLPEGKATVRFTYEDGRAADVQIVRSTGSAILDGSLISQIEHTSLPPAYGVEKLESHAFQFDFAFEATVQDFGAILKRVITRQTVGNLRAATHSYYGYVLAEFHYLDGRVLDAKSVYVSGDPLLGEAVVDQLLHVEAPPPISVLSGKKMRFLLAFCFMTNPADCNQFQQAAYQQVQKSED